jgi:hypothetical protein
VNVTFNGAGPESGSPLNDANGAAALTGTTAIHKHRRITPAITQKKPFTFISDLSSQLSLLPAHPAQEPIQKRWPQHQSLHVPVSSVTSRFFSSTSGIVGSQQDQRTIPETFFMGYIMDNRKERILTILSIAPVHGITLYRRLSS